MSEARQRKKLRLDNTAAAAADEDEDAVNNNPYLAHMKKVPKLVPRHTTAADAEHFENADSNIFTGRAYTKRYRDILTKRRNLPVHKQRDEFLDLIHNNQILILVGETGSGKTTQ